MAAQLWSLIDVAEPWVRPELLLAVPVDGRNGSTVLRCADGVEHRLREHALDGGGPSLLFNESGKPPSALAMRSLRMGAIGTAGLPSPSNALLLLRPAQRLHRLRRCAVGAEQPRAPAGDGWATGGSHLPGRRVDAPLGVLEVARRLAHNASLGIERAVHGLPRREARVERSCLLPLRRAAVRGGAAGAAPSFLSLDEDSEIAARLTAMHEAGADACAVRFPHDLADSLAVEVHAALEAEFVMTLVKAIAVPLLMTMLVPFVRIAAHTRSTLPAPARPPAAREPRRTPPLCLPLSQVQQLMDDLLPVMNPVLMPAIQATAEPFLVMFM